MSAAAAPSPEKYPDIFPYCKDLVMHIMAIAPTGRATKKPTNKPEK